MKNILTFLVVIISLQTMGQNPIVVKPAQTNMEEQRKKAEKLKEANRLQVEQDKYQAENDKRLSDQTEQARMQSERDKNHAAHAGAQLTQIRFTLLQIPASTPTSLAVFKDRRLKITSSKGIVLELKLEDMGKLKPSGNSYNESYTFIPQQITTYGDLLKSFMWTINFTKNTGQSFSGKVLWTLNFSDGNIVKLLLMDGSGGGQFGGLSWIDVKTINVLPSKDLIINEMYLGNRDFATHAEIYSKYVPKD